MTTTPRKRLTADQRRAAIQGSAMEVFAERGYHASSIDDIARAAGISKALIYEHFASKQALHADLLEAQASELFKRVSDAVAAVEAESSAARLKAGMEAFFRFVEERRDAWRVLFRETVDPESAAALDRVGAQITSLVAGLIAEDPGAKPRDQAHPAADPGIQVLAQMLVGSIQSVANWWADHTEVRRELVLETAMEFAWLGLDRVGQGEHWPVE
ncbi:MAG: TetR/AcrR family transcriptional regulator [Thermoleophilaceae bacterium]|nr:TetR/AcrR family transcriptional regulator [Thermoleophilaceae bacterium]